MSSCLYYGYPSYPPPPSSSPSLLPLPPIGTQIQDLLHCTRNTYHRKNVRKTTPTHVNHIAYSLLHTRITISFGIFHYMLYFDSFYFSFVRGLTLLHKDFRAHMLSANNAHEKVVATEETLNQILSSNLGGIYQLNTELLLELEERLLNW